MERAMWWGGFSLLIVYELGEVFALHILQESDIPRTLPSFLLYCACSSPVDGQVFLLLQRRIPRATLPMARSALHLAPDSPI